MLGGVLVDVLDWRAIFWTRVPLGVMGSLLVWRFLRDTPPASRPRGLDIPGSAILFGMLSSLVLAVNRGDAWGWSSPAILGLFVASGSLLIAFILVERRSLSPVVDLALFKLRSYTASISAATLQFFGLSAVIILGPFYLVDARGFSTLEAGAILAAFPIAMLVISPFSGALSDRVGARLPSTCGLALACGALLFTATLDTDSSVAGIVVRLFLVGAGTALFSSPNTSTIMASVPPDRLGTASASQTTARTVGNSLGVAVAVALFSGQAAAYAASHSALGLDDPAIAPAAMVSGLRLALYVAAAVVAVGIPVSLLRGPPPARPADAVPPASKPTAQNQRSPRPGISRPSCGAWASWSWSRCRWSPAMRGAAPAPSAVAPGDAAAPAFAILWAGDTLLGDTAQPLLDRHGYGWPFARLAGALRADFTLVNLEGPITTDARPWDPGQRWSYNAQPASAAALATAGVDAVSLANNHALDRGPEGLAATAGALAAAGLTGVGVGLDAVAKRPLLIETRTGSWASSRSGPRPTSSGGRRRDGPARSRRPGRPSGGASRWRGRRARAGWSRSCTGARTTRRSTRHSGARPGASRRRATTSSSGMGRTTPSRSK